MKAIRKSPIIIAFFSLIAFFAFAKQEKVLQIFRNGEIIQEYAVDDIDYIEVNDLIPAPDDVSASVTNDEITIRWNPVDGATYDLYRSPDNVNFTLLASKLTETTYTDTKPLQGTNFYRVKAFIGDAESGFTSSVSATLTNSELDSGIYLGLMGFNQSLYEYSLGLLDENSYSEINAFIDGLTTKNGTLLYYSVEKALDAMQAANYPSDLSNVTLVTFTDGLDQGSYMMNNTYENDLDYLNALQNRISTVMVGGRRIDAYSIGLRGNDVKDTQMFRQNLIKLASDPSNAKEVASISEVNDELQKIADQISFNTYVQTISLSIPGVANGTLIRFTFDNMRNAEESQLYLQGKFNLKNKSLDEIEYHGLTCTSGTSVQGTVNGIFVNFSFEGIRTDNNSLISNESIDEWTYVASNSSWQINSEFDKSQNTEINIERSSAAIMLVIDCSSSLGSDFSTVQSNAKSFVRTLYNTNDTTSSSSNKEEITVNGVKFNMISVSGGTYMMGSNDGDYDERPVHSVNVDSFKIGETEVTQGLWEVVMGSNPSYFRGDDNLPVENVSYYECQTFISKLNEITGMHFRFLTEEEWEYAARGGNKSNGYLYSGSNNIDDVAWYENNSESKTHLVGKMKPNELGIYDMSGNVWEWTSSWYHGRYDSTGSNLVRVQRGGCWKHSDSSCRVTSRVCDSFTESGHTNYLGLRLAL